MGAVSALSEALGLSGTNISSAVGGNLSNPNQTSRDIVAENAQMASSENSTLQQENMQNQVQANNARPDLYIDNPRRSLAKLASNASMLNNNQNLNNR